jgi:tetratricopeptide (TPR) repeat protein
MVVRPITIVVLSASVVVVTAWVKAGITTPRGTETLETLECRAQQNPLDYTAWNRIADARLRLLASTGDLANLTLAAGAVKQSLKTAVAEANPAGLALRVRVELACHQFREAKASAEKLCSIQTQHAYPLGLLGDACFNLGEYEACESAWKRMTERESTILLVEPRLAQLDLVQGKNNEARRRYGKVLEEARRLERQAPDVIAWANLQLGELAFVTGDWETAEQHYQSALSVQPDYYSAIEHKAELLGAQGKLDEAAALYSRLIERVPRPEVMHALGDLYLFFGQQSAAAPWHAKALAAYLASTARGEAIYFHNLAALYADSLNDPDRALAWARRDFATRQSVQAYDAVAWALYKTGNFAEARDTILRALISDTKNPHILYHAGTILLRAGDIAAGKARLQETVAINPRYNTFHVHRG